MPSHGAASTLTVLQWDRNREAAAASAGPRQQPLSGYRHFMGALGPSEHERFTLYNKPFEPSDTSAWKRAEVLMGKLAQIMVREAPNARDNPCVPSGYTYFLQLVAHDLVHSSILLSRSGGQMIGLSNERKLPLRLQTIYGGGPTECPHAYQPVPGFRSSLRIGPIRENAGLTIPGSYSDIPRGQDVTQYRNYEFPEPLIADPRNDAHAIIAQMVVLFHRLHNYILRIAETNIPSTGNPFVDAQRRLVAAQAMTIQVYRGIIRNDLLRRILHPAVYDAYENARVPLLNTADGLESGTWFAPLEFAFGFLRFAHGMIRATYHFNDPTLDPFNIAKVLVRNSEYGAPDMPLERQWTIAWPLFFSFGSPARNLSLRIAPQISSALEYKIDQLDPHHGGGLAYRDMLSSIAVRPWSIGALVRKLKPTHDELLNLSPLLRLPDQQPADYPWEIPIHKWLDERCDHSNPPLNACDTDTLAKDPPIPFFVRFEADFDADGEHLGVLGSIVIADVLYGIMRHDPIMGVGGVDSQSSQIEALENRIFGSQGVFAPLHSLTEFSAFIAAVV